MVGIGIGVVLILVISQWIANRDEKISRREAQLAEERRMLLSGGTISAEDANKILEIQGKDTDGDGLKDWEEGLWGTNPTLVDTNENGVSDFNEVQNRKNSLQQEAPIEVASAELEELTPTDIFTRDFYATASLIEQRDIENADELVREVFFQNIAGIQLYTPIDETRITTVPENEATIIAYAKSLKALMDKYPFNSNELGTILDGLASTAENINLENSALGTKYQRFANEMITLRAPEGLKKMHSDMVNASLLLQSVITGIVQSEDDPLTSLSAYIQFTDAVGKFSDAYAQIYTYLEQAVAVQLDNNSL